MLNKDLRNLIYSGVLGDGHIIKDSKYLRMSFSSVKLDYIQYKRDLFRGHLYVSKLWVKKGSGYSKNNTTYEFAVGSSKELNSLLKKTRISIIKELSLQSLILYFLDEDRKSTRLNSSHANISYAVFCLKKNNSS